MHGGKQGDQAEHHQRLAGDDRHPAAEPIGDRAAGEVAGDGEGRERDGLAPAPEPLGRRLPGICCRCYIWCVLIDWSSNFGSWLDLLESQADAGQPGAQERLDIVLAQLSYLQELKDPPEADTPTLRRVRQTGAYPVWRVSHPYREGVAIRLIVWFPAEAPPMIILFANDKAVMGDVFYDSVGSRADQVIKAFLRAQGGTQA